MLRVQNNAVVKIDNLKLAFGNQVTGNGGALDVCRATCCWKIPKLVLVATRR